MQDTTFVAREQMVEGFLDGARRLKDKLQTIRVLLAEDMTPVKEQSYHLLSRLLKPETHWDRLLYAHIFKTVIQAEVVGAGGGFVAASCTIGFIEFLARGGWNIEVLRDMEPNQREGMVRAVESCSRPVSVDDINLATNNCGKELSVALQEAVVLAGMEGNIVVEESSQVHPSVELRVGCSFKNLVVGSGESQWRGEGVRVLCVDGLVDRVSEIDKLLVGAATSHTPLMIVAQGFAEEVAATVGLNNNRQVFKVLLVQVLPSLETLNVIGDVACVSNSDVVSVLNGDSVVFKTFDLLPTVNSVRATTTEVVIYNPSSQPRVASQVKMLLDKRRVQTEGMDMTPIFDKRISSLLANTVVIRLPVSTKLLMQKQRTEIDDALRSIRAMLSHGVVDRAKLLATLDKSKVLEAVLLDTVSRLNVDPPAISVAVGAYLGFGATKTLMESSGAVLVDRVR